MYSYFEEFLKSFVAQSRIMCENSFQNSKSLAAMTQWWQFNCCKDFLQFIDILNVVKNSFCLQLLVNFFLAFTFQIRNNQTHMFKSVCHVEQNKKTVFPWCHPCICMYMYSNRSWATINHSMHCLQVILQIKWNTKWKALHCPGHSQGTGGKRVDRSRSFK